MYNIEDASIDFALATKGITTMIIWEPQNPNQYRGMDKERSFRFKNREDEKVISQPTIEETLHPTVSAPPPKNVEVKLKLVDDYILRYPGVAPMD